MRKLTEQFKKEIREFAITIRSKNMTPMRNFIQG